MSAAKQNQAAGADRDRAVGHPATVRHLRIGWWSLALFGMLGLALETLHGFKVGWYLDVSNDTRRLMWTLAHAHGTLLGLVHLGFAFTVERAALDPQRIRPASSALVGASLLLPGGFFLGGIRFYAGDPGIGVAVVPIGAVLVIYAAVVVAREIGRPRASRRSSQPGPDNTA